MNKLIKCAVLVSAIAALVACGPLEEGTEGQACLADGTCNAGLVCNASNICEATGGSGFTALYNSGSFQQCSGCHAPDAAGFTDGTEASQNWSSRDTAYQGVQGTASGLLGNFEGCNGVPFIGQTPGDSLLVAALDETVRANFSLDGFPDCNADSISDMTLRIGGALSAEEATLLDSWISAGAQDN